MSDLQVGRLTTLLRRLLVLGRGSEHPAPEIADELQPVVIVEGERSEHRFLAGEWLCGVHRAVPAVVGERGEVRLINPPTTRMLLVVESISVWSTASAEYYLFGLPNSPPGLATPARHTRRDTRLPDLAFSASDTTIGSNAAINPIAGRTIQNIAVVLNQLERFDGEHVLAPGGGIEVQCGSLNTAFNVNFVMRERALEPSETR